MALESRTPLLALPPVSLGPLIQKRRQELGLTQADLAQRIGPSTLETEIAALESQQFIMPSWIRLRQLAEVLELPLDSLLDACLIHAEIT